jgi:hypothetical protein
MKNALIIIFILIGFSLFSQQITLENIFTPEEIQKTKSGEITARMFLKNDPQGVNTHKKMDVPKTQYTKEDFSKYEMVVDEKAFIPYTLTNESKLKFYNALTSFSKAKGMLYYSRRIAQVQQLILNCYTVKSGTSKKQIADPVFSEVRPYIENYFVQEDNKFGIHTFKNEIYNEGDNFVMINSNMDAIVPLSSKGEYKFISFFIYDKQSEGYYYYSINSMKINPMFLKLLTDRTNATLFSNRLRAMSVHFAKMIGLNWSDKINPWNEGMLNQGKYRTY